MTPEHRLWCEVLKTFIEDAPFCITLEKRAEFLAELDSPWARHVCVMLGVNYGGFRSLVLTHMVGDQCKSI